MEFLTEIWAAITGYGPQVLATLLVVSEALALLPFLPNGIIECLIEGIKKLQVLLPKKEK